MIWDYCDERKLFTEKTTSSKGNFIIKAIGTYINTFGNIYFWEGCNVYFWTNLFYSSLCVVNIYYAPVLVDWG